jgi:hypothetical protein
MADKKYKLSLQLTVDGSQAKQEAQRTGKAIESIADSQKGALRLLVDGSQARKELEAIAQLARKNAQIIEKPRMFARPAVDLGVKQGGIISTGRKFGLKPMEKQERERLDQLMAKSVTVPIKADGKPALTEGEKIRERIRKMDTRLPLHIRVYGSVFKGLGGDISRTLGLDKIGGDMQSGLGKALSWVKAGFLSLWKAASFAFRGISAGIRLVGSMIKAGLTMPVRLATGAFKALGVAAAAVGAGVYAGIKAIGPAAEMEQYSIQLEVMLKNAGKAKARLAELSKYAKETNYGVKEIMEAGNLMEAFGFYSKRNLELAGDAANAFGKDIREVIYSLNYLASGRGGEAFRSLATIGVTREKLEPYGVKFNNSGQLVTDSKKAFDAVLRYFEGQFGGMTKRQSKTWRGATQQLGGEVYKAFADGFKKAVKPLTEFVTGIVIPLAGSIGEYLQTIPWDKIQTS